MRVHAAALVAAALAAGAAQAAQCHATATGPVAVVELYTSEGCNSCPPADRWLSQLARHDGLPVPVVALALHVPYWDYIGWRDRFASPQFEARQREAARRGRSPTVYTPQVMLNGRDFRGWSSPAFGETLSRLAAMPGRAAMTLVVETSAAGAEIALRGQGPAGARVVLARYEDGLVSEVRAGENAGVRLAHDRVVRDWVELGRIADGGAFAYRRALPSVGEAGGVAALIEDPDSGEILQALALPHCAAESARPGAGR